MNSCSLTQIGSKRVEKMELWILPVAVRSSWSDCQFWRARLRQQAVCVTYLGIPAEQSKGDMITEGKKPPPKKKKTSQHGTK